MQMRHERRPSAGASYHCSLAFPDEAFSQNTDLLPGLDQEGNSLADVPKTDMPGVQLGRDCGERRMEGRTPICLPSRWEWSSLLRDRCACSQILLPTKSMNVFATAQRKAV